MRPTTSVSRPLPTRVTPAERGGRRVRLAPAEATGARRVKRRALYSGGFPPHFHPLKGPNPRTGVGGMQRESRKPFFTPHLRLFLERNAAPARDGVLPFLAPH